MAPRGSIHAALISATPFSPRPCQLTSDSPDGSMATSTRPSGRVASTSSGAVKVSPPSTEIAARTRAFPPAIVNHAAATASPRAARAGPFTGHATIFQPSLENERGEGVGARGRTREMSRNSASERSRYAARRPFDVFTMAVWQQSHTFASSSDSRTRLPSLRNSANRRVIAPAPDLCSPS